MTAVVQGMPGTPKVPIRVLVVDDSSLVRHVLRSVLESDPEISVIGTAADPYIAVDKIREEVPDVIILDVEMPRMDGITFLRKIMEQHPIPVVICSSLAAAGAETALLAVEAGAVEIIQKPRIDTRRFLLEARLRVCDAVKAAACTRRPRAAARQAAAPQPKLTADVMLAKASRALAETTEKVVVVGASTGGTEALRVLLEGLPPDTPGVVVVQHMPEHFTAAFAQRLDGLCRASVKEAAQGDTVMRGRVLIAPGNRHTLLKRSGARYYVEVRDGPLVCRQRPSVDVLFRSAARYAGRNAVGVILTGMGDDGARGMREMHEVGAYNIAQDEQTSVVWGMPQEAIKMGSIDRVLPLECIAQEVVRRCL